LIVESEKNLLADNAEVIAENGRQFLAMRRQETACSAISFDKYTGALLLEVKYIMFLRARHSVRAFCLGI
jgi:hypothetical protein